MSVVATNPPSHRLHISGIPFNPFSISNMADAASDRRMSNANDGSSMHTTLILRRLPRNTTAEALRTMLLFAKDLQDTEIIPTDLAEDNGYVTAAARFSSITGASEARNMLDGKTNTSGQAPMIVEMATNTAVGSGRRSTMESTSTRASMPPISPPPSQMPKSSRFNGTFQSMEKMSPPPGSLSAEQFNAGHKPMHSIFAAPSPNQLKDGTRVSGKSVIGDDVADDETGQLLKDPLAYMKNDTPALNSGPRQSNNPRGLVGSFGSLSLNTNMGTTSTPSFASPRSALHTTTPSTAFSPGGNVYQNSTNHYLRHNYPPVNPADQNPPCNTLYVGNLPMDTSEDELKAMFSKQRGYKRLCFRTKQNGPMCFVEFEDISFATKALNELYGAQLHNSVKGGIRLSFSKNPLGVRSGQPGSNNPATPLSPGGGMFSAMSPLSPGSFTTANGPPPGLSVPPGLSLGASVSPPLVGAQYTGQAFPHGMSPSPGGRGAAAVSNGTNGHQLGTMYPDYMMGR